MRRRPTVEELFGLKPASTIGLYAALKRRLSKAPSLALVFLRASGDSSTSRAQYAREMEHADQSP
jgi:hypothetical protein